MNRIWIALAANALFAAAAHAGAFEGEDHTNATLLISTSGEDMRAAARALARHATTNPAMLDLAANMLWLGCKGQRGLPSDAQVALGAALGQSGRLRYRDVLTYCADRALHQDVKDSTEEALALLPSDNTNNEIQFVGGSIRLYDVSTQLAASVSRDAAKRPARVLAEVTPGQPIEAVYQRVGLPDSVAAEGEGIIAHYGSGAVPFTPAREGWRIAGASPAIAAAPRAPQTPKPRPPAVAPKPPVVTAAPAPQSPPKPAPAAPRAAAPAPTPVVAPSPPPVQVAPPAPVAGPAAGAFKAGQVAHLRAGAQVRTRPLADAKTVGTRGSDALTLKSQIANASGTWWFVDYQNTIGWVLESDLAP